MRGRPFSVDIKPDWESLVRCIRREGTPRRVHHIELFLDGEIQAAICDRFGLLDGIDPADHWYWLRRQIAIQRFLGYDTAACGVEGAGFETRRLVAADTAPLPREDGRSFMEEHRGPITNWEEFEKYPWPNPKALKTRALEWMQTNLPDGMCNVGQPMSHFCEHICWLMGYETLCFALHEQRDLVIAIRDRLEALYTAAVELMLQFDRVKMVFGSDDMGFKTGLLFRFNAPGLIPPTFSRLTFSVGCPS